MIYGLANATSVASGVWVMFVHVGRPPGFRWEERTSGLAFSNQGRQKSELRPGALFVAQAKSFPHFALWTPTHLHGANMGLDGALPECQH